MKTLSLRFGDTTITIVAIPDNIDSAAAERACRHVIGKGAHPYPVMGRLAWQDVIDAGFATGILEMPKDTP